MINLSKDDLYRIVAADFHVDKIDKINVGGFVFEYKDAPTQDQFSREVMARLFMRRVNDLIQSYWKDRNKKEIKSKWIEEFKTLHKECFEKDCTNEYAQRAVENCGFFFDQLTHNSGFPPEMIRGKNGVPAWRYST
jgi:predicted Ser/Thr protein kinase